MFRAFKLLIYPVRSLLLRVLPALVLLYAVLMPAQLSLFPGYDALDSARRMFSLAQIFLPLSLLWSLFLYFLPIYGTQSRELLAAMPDILMDVAPFYYGYLIRFGRYLCICFIGNWYLGSGKWCYC